MTGWRGLIAVMLGTMLCVARSAPNAAETLATHDLQGIWTLGTYTNFERPKDLKALVLTPAEAEAFEAPRRALHGMLGSKAGEVGQPESEFPERGDGLARVKGEIRSSWVIDPADGKVPFIKEVRLRFGFDKPSGVHPLVNPEDGDSTDRCIGNSAAGAPMIGNADTNLFEIVQTPDAMAILTEKYHDVRVVSLLGVSEPIRNAPSRLGDSIGHWEGDTLVVQTSNFQPGEFVRGHSLVESEHSKVTERFTRIGPGQMLYEFTVEDPTLYTAPWRGEMVLQLAKGALYEYACHEGNYSFPSMLRAARMADKKAPATKGGN